MEDEKKPLFCVSPMMSVVYIAAAAYMTYAAICYFSAPYNGAYTSAFYFIHMPLHEFGHLVFGLLHMPEAATAFAGTLFQLLTPVAAGINFIRIKEYPALAVCLAWLGFAVLDMAVYMEDALDLELPLVSPFSGGGPVEHDWNTLFDMMGVLGHARGISDFFSVSGYVLAGLGIASVAAMVLRGLYKAFCKKGAG